MAERYIFFNSTPTDLREYQAQDFANYFGSVLSSGLLHLDGSPNLKADIVPGTLETVVSAGKAIMQGHLYENTTNLNLSHGLPEPELDRIDRVVLRLDRTHMNRFVLLQVKQGTPAENPTPPALQRDDFIYEISLARVRVRANTSQLFDVDIIDERMYEDLCGLVFSLISIPTSHFQEQWDAFFSETSGEVREAADIYLQNLLDAEAQLQASLAGFNADLQASFDSFESQWRTWFDNQQTEGFVLEPEFYNHKRDLMPHLVKASTGEFLSGWEINDNYDGLIFVYDDGEVG